jgi:hypothetical protein
MDCITYRRKKLATPQDASPEMISHAQTCRECVAFTGQLNAFEQDLHAALHVPVSEGLAEKIILRRGTAHWFKAAWLPMAAAVMITLAILVTFNQAPSGDGFARKFITHVLSEPNIVATDGQVETDALRLAFANFGGRIDNDLGEVIYLNRCQIAGVESTHVQVSTSAGDAALLLRPGRKADVETPEVYEGQAVVIVPVPRGSLAIVAATPRQASEIKSLVLAHTDFRG